jgi:hypothetical protein
MQTVPLCRGGTCDLLEVTLSHVVLEVSSVWPPGSTLELEVEGTLGVKVRNCRKVSAPEAAPRFRVEGRWTGLTRAQRSALHLDLA